ncbi:Gfo/Idh/MocA family protein [Limisphaera sp. VF-2]|uniref:Gfo/Idh/MocA family protein n=1 Tax=Limisphaera sp. VF-2 TaxID=3400418 RepID=UPI003C1E614D
MKRLWSRRRFLRSQLQVMLAAGVAPACIPGTALGANGRAAPSNRVVVGAIGVGPQGRAVMGGFLALPDVQVVAVCDVKQDQLELARRAVNQHYQNADCRTYGDFRGLLARSDVDAVLIATPDHWHVHVAVAAVRAGKDIYLEKPMGLSLAEDQILRREVQTHRRVFQFGTQQRSSREFQRACALVREGRIGRLQQIRVWCLASRPGGSTTPAPVPPTLDYDFWLGPAPFSPYTEDKCAADNKTWWFIYDYALGWIAGWGVHPLDIALWGHPNMLGGPLEVEGRAVFPTEGACNTAVAWHVAFRFHDGVRLEFRGTRNGYAEVNELNDLRPWEAQYGPIADHGTVFEGDEGWALVHRGLLRTHPESLAESSDRLVERLPRLSLNHVRDFVDAVRTRRPTVCPIEEAFRADLLCQLSDIATRVPRRLRFDPRQERFLEDPEANRRLELRPRRRPWHLA